jgi:hypothetical protein
VMLFVAEHESGFDAVAGSPPALKCHPDSEEPNMQAVTTIGLDIAKSVFQVHGV